MYGMAPLHADDQHLIDTITKTTIGPHDLLVFRSLHPLSHTAMESIRAALKRKNLDGVLLAFLTPDTDLEVLPEADARRFYERLKLRFGS